MPENSFMRREDGAAAELVAARAEIARLRSLTARAESRRHDAELALVAAKAQNERYVAQLLAVRHSRSWKITRPIRSWKRRESAAAD
jgi:hypothetical protein